MNRSEDIDAAHLLAMPQAELDAFVSKSIRTKSLSKIVIRLNDQVIEKSDPAAKAARAALQRIGFPD